MKIKAFKLVTGEEIIGTLVKTFDTEGGGYVLKKVRTVQMIPTGPNQMGIGLVPFAVSCVDEEIQVFKRHIVAAFTHSSELEDGYLQQTSGIQLASAANVPLK